DTEENYQAAEEAARKAGLDLREVVSLVQHEFEELFGDNPSDEPTPAPAPSPSPSPGASPCPSDGVQPESDPHYMMWAAVNCGGLLGNLPRETGPYTYAQLTKLCPAELRLHIAPEAKEKVKRPILPSVWGEFVEAFVRLRKASKMDTPLARHSLGEWIVQKPLGIGPSSGQIVWYPFSYDKDGKLRPPLIPAEWKIVGMIQSVTKESDGVLAAPRADRATWFQLSQQWKAPVFILNNTGVQVFDDNIGLAWQLLWWHNVRQCYSF
ncbi:MAG: hypothetical protein HY595_00340, partial [Candidatus Omnitrophica bacterium]|nr:hypothetical protein [Candidatus Omnitrophota bacterium]